MAERPQPAPRSSELSTVPLVHTAPGLCSFPGVAYPRCVGSLRRYGRSYVYGGAGSYL